MECLGSSIEMCKVTEILREHNHGCNLQFQEEALAAEKENAALLLTKADRCDAEHQLLSDTLACARACFCYA